MMEINTGCLPDLLRSAFDGWDASVTLALFALLVTIWAAHSSRSSASWAQRIFNQSMYSERRAVYDAFLVLHYHLLEKGERPVSEMVVQFERHSHTARIFFSESLATEIVDHYKRAHRLAEHARAHPGFAKLPPDMKDAADRLFRDSPNLIMKMQSVMKVV